MTQPDYQRLAVEHREAVALHAAKLREYSAAPLHAICPACLTRLRVPATRLGGRLRRHGGCSCRAAVADAVRLAALDASERAEGLRYRAAVRRTVAQGPRGWRPGDLRAIGRWEDRAAVLEHRALRLREWVR